MKSVIPFVIPIFFFSVWLLSGCESLLPGAPEDEDVLAGPLEGLTHEQMERHIVGDEEFAAVFGPEDGLGPIFVHNSCEGCHVGDGKGHPFTTLTRFGKYDASSGSWDPLLSKGGPQLQHRAISNFIAEEIPSEANGIARFVPPAVTGLGFIEHLEDSSILALVDSLDADADGISGIPNYIDPPDFFVPKSRHIPNNGKYIGRFGKKAAAINLLHQTSNAYVQDMGITSDFITTDLTNVQVDGEVGDDAPEPEVPSSTVNNVVFYVKTLKAPPRRNEDNPDVVSGELLFSQIGCDKCHVSTFTSGEAEVDALSNKVFHPYSDFLLHDMGDDLNDNYIEGTSLPSEWRTAPLWGLGLAKDSQGGQYFLLHDGRATSIHEAIEFHGGEAEQIKNSYLALSDSDQSKLINFLESL